MISQDKYQKCQPHWESNPGLLTWLAEVFCFINMLPLLKGPGPGQLVNWPDANRGPKRRYS
ncbi:hypothetical protein M407DRAFT_244403 [Tulasnella calospora MUT 4182]|uniref:Uncharacterized protein n=1 Tax=Tulasnella calospora MUT 4182 TaxID=1051891 RepID=A0A0C3KSU1_9AGAM|nr:hypothetical protein M407DRAFT_244403 [Tulasnella calospora MUT 4182]